MKKMMSLLLALVLVLSLAACGGNNEPTTEPTTTPTTAPTTEATTEPTTAPTTEATTEPEGNDNAITYFTLSVNKNYVPVKRMDISDNYDGTVYVEYVGDVHKKSFNFDGAALTEIANAVAGLDLTSLGESVYGEGSLSFSLYVSYADGSMVMYDFYGEELADNLQSIVDTMDAAFKTALENLEVYVPQIVVMGDVDAAILDAMQEIMNNSGIENLDSLGVTGIAIDENFGFAAGLSSSEGITAGANCANMMMGGAAYQLVVVTLEDEANASAVAADFETNMDWNKWVCVRPSDALIAQKGNMVLCLMGSDTMFSGTSAAIKDAGWTVIKTLTDPGM